MPVNRQTAPADINIGDLSIYVGGGGFPEGDYALEFTAFTQTEDFQGKPIRPHRVGVLVTAHNLNDTSEEARQQFYSLGSAVSKSWAPNPDTGKGFRQIPDAPAVQTIPPSTNWGVFLKALYDCGLPQGIFANDLSVLDGVHVHMANVPEPEERKGFAQTGATSEVQGERPKGKGTIAVPTEIKEDGKPWEGSGGIPEKTDKKPAAPAKGKIATAAQVNKPAAGKPNGKVAPKAAPAPAQAAAAAEGPTDDDILNAAIAGASAVLEKNPNGCAKLVMRTGTFKAVTEAEGDDMANSVIETFFASDDAIDGLLGQLGYTLNGQKVVAQG